MPIVCVRIALFLVIASIISSLCCVKRSAAQEPVTIISDVARVDFPNHIDFRLSAQAEVEIIAAELEYGPTALTCNPVATIGYPDFVASTDVDLTLRWHVTEGEILPPGAQFWWRWHLLTAGGETIVTPEQVDTFSDSWFVWQSIERDNLRVHWYRGEQAMAEQMLEVGLDILDQMADEFGLRLTEPIDIYLYDDPAALQASVPGAPGWIGGIAFPKHSIILLLAWSDCLPECSRILRHELGHLVFTRLTFNCTTSPPTWLAEGLATNVEGGGDDLYADQLASAIEGDRLLSLAQLEGSFSVHSRTAGLAYAQSYSIVRFLIEQYGRDRLVALMQEITAGEPFDQALMTIYELNRPQLEAEWRAAMGASSQIPGIEEASELPTVVPTFALPSPVVSTENPTITPRTANEPPPDTPTAERQQSSTAVANTKAQPTLEGDGTDSQSEVKGVQQQNWPVFLALSIVFVLFLAVYYLLWSRRKN